MIPYEVLVTAVSERSDLFVETMESMLTRLDSPVQRVIVHEDVRKGSAPGAIAEWLAKMQRDAHLPEVVHQVTSPARGLGPAMHWCFRQAKTPIVFYTQEDWRFVRDVPVQRCLALMEHAGLNHVRFNKRKTMRCKHQDTDHPWHKVEVRIPDGAGGEQTLCISDHWYTQASLWRVRPALPGLAANAELKPQANAFVAGFNDFMNRKYSGDVRRCMDQTVRHERLKTYIWGPVGEPAFIQHLGSVRTTGPIVHKSGA